MAEAATKHVTILLASYQGGRYLRRQLLSIAGQSYGNWSVIISDDGSVDETAAILAGFAAAKGHDRVRLLRGPGKGATSNFLNLLGSAPSGGMVAFCDQDDVWHPHKLARAVDALSRHSGPAHYASRTIICNQHLYPLAGSRDFGRPFGFRNAMVQACMAGNTSVFNAAAVAVLQNSVHAAQAANIVSHDWWAYQVTSGINAALIHDPRPGLYYRQHPDSEVGRNDTNRALLARAGKLFAGEYGDWLAANCAALHGIRDQLTPENQEVLDQFSQSLNQRGLRAMATLSRTGVYRHTKAGTIALYAAAGLGRLRQVNAI